MNSLADLHDMVQEEGESLRQFNKRFNLVRRSIPGISVATVIEVYQRNVRNERIREKLAIKEVSSLSEIFRLTDKCAREEELPGPEPEYIDDTTDSSPWLLMDCREVL